MRFRIDHKSAYAMPGDTGNVARFDILVDGLRRGLTAVRDAQGYWAADIVGVRLVDGLWNEQNLVSWLTEHVDPEILLPRPADPQFAMEV